ncbi:metallophosphoesterase [Chryseobacterium sp. FH1]|uniref:metallophosphoesterase n=1 Tax=Chryseobacterium sp. FH1 TaxID=1233951 RepID=UPI0004E39084|nr:metallophosphoesterase [Chryseobacterium sp. FH1]KFC19525.1 phosphoesterase [Chryseobacterium sp. FH1]
MKNNLTTLFLLLCLLQSCATYQPQYIADAEKEVYPEDKRVVHTFFLIGDAGNGQVENTINHSNFLESALKDREKNSTLLFLGDNIYPAGMPDTTDTKRTDAEKKMQNQIDLASVSKGKTIFIPGNHDWYNDGVKGLKRQQEFVEKQLGKKSFLPKNGCAIETIDISDDIVLIIVDSQWYIANWNKEPTINENCEIKTRTDFLDEFRSEVKKSRGKTTLVAIHHPMFSNGPHGGQYSFKSHLKPFPVLGSFKNLIRETSGISNADMQNEKYNELKKNLVAAAQQNDKVIFVSGHENSLQYIVEDNLHQVISGSGSKTSPTRNSNGGKFSYGVNGYAIVDVFDDGSSFVRFINSNDNKVLYQSNVLPPDIKKQNSTFDTDFPSEIKSAIYDKKAITKSKYYNFLWGKRYRESYGIPITAKTVRLDTLFGGLTPIRKGGGNQSRTLRLKNKEGKQYVIRAMRKDAGQYIQSAFFKDQYVVGKFKETATEALIMDVFTGSFPYAALVVNPLSDAIGLYHLNSKLYYIPKQKALDHFNDEFGDELYMMEEQASDGNFEIKDPDFTGKIISTNELIEELHSDESKTMDEPAYIKARLFDMLINDWDRHYDQWRWLEFKKNGKTVFKPLPRDRDQAFSKMSDGFILGSAVKLIPAAKLLRKYSNDLKDVKGFNVEPYPLDVAFIKTSDKAVWDEQVRLIQNNLTEKVIESAFRDLPKEINDENVTFIKKTLKARMNNLQQISDRYFKVINKYGVITATNKDDIIKIESSENGNITVSLFRKKNDSNELYIHKVYDPKLTKELWVYGLDDKDNFEVSGISKKIKIRLIGGQNNDKFTVQNGKNIFIYDYKTKNNTIEVVDNAKVKLRDDYEVNTYDYKKLKTNTNQIIPTIGANPDDGLKIGLQNVYTLNGFERNPFTARHQLNGAYYFATNGYELNYRGEFANIMGRFNLLLESNFHSPNFSQNFFGYGNETKNDDDIFGMDYNRVKVKEFGFSPSLVWKGNGGGNLSFGLSYKSIEVENTKNRFIGNTTATPQTIFGNNQFAGVNSKYEFENYDNKAFPTIGIKTALEVGFISNLEDKKRNFVYMIPEVSFNHKLIPSGKLVLATLIKSHIVFNSNYEFYQAASIGGNDGLRGFRNQRFAGQHSLFHNTDIRYTFNSFTTAILPLKLGIYGGFDYGRIWVKDDNSTKWNNSYGGGLFVNGAEIITGNLGVFNSIDGVRVSFALGFQF